MVLHRLHSNNITVIQNYFIDEYMVSANGEFVKVYLYLLRCSSSDQDISLSSIADKLNCTENDVKRALNYWEKLHLLHLSYDSAGYLSDISFAEPSQLEDRSSQRIAQYAVSFASPEESTGKDTEKESSAASLSAAVRSETESDSVRIHVSAQRKKELSGEEEVTQLLFVASQYLGKQLSATEVEHLLYFYDELHLSSDLIEYLIEYCVSKGVKSIHYIRKVAFDWAQAGVKTVEDAKKDSNTYHKEYYAILKAFGIFNRGPAEAEITYMDNWLNVLGYTMDIILEACGRTITKIHNPSFPYTDSILQDWNKKGVRHLSDIEKLENNAQIPSRKNSASGKKSGTDFGFESRDYDYKKLEEQLLGY